MSPTSCGVTVGMAFVEDTPDVATPGLTLSREMIPERFVYQYDSDPSRFIPLMVISLSLASLSVIAALSAFYMFVRMRRAFYHDLIMLLIQSDMLKAIWLVICPLVYFIHGPVDSSGIFCQVSGFFLTATIEAADIAVLMIALHTALTILLPRRFGGGAGLYPYRHIAYLCWAVIPLTLAAIVPLTGSKFADDGPHCYLPITPTWYRLMLSWVPRYIVLTIILLTYAGIYIYVKFQLARFCRAQRRPSNSDDDLTPCHVSPYFAYLCHRREKRNSDISTPPPTYRSRFNSAGAATGPAREDPRDRQSSIADTIAMSKLGQEQQQPPPIALPKPAWCAQREPISWRPINFNPSSASETQSQPHPPYGAADTEIDNPQNQPTTITIDNITSGNAPAGGEPYHDSTPAPNMASPTPQQQSARSRLRHWRWPPISRRLHTDSNGHTISGSGYHFLDILRYGPMRGQTATTTATRVTTPEVAVAIHLPTDATEEAMRRSRDNVHRQLRLLFVYPTFYVLTWIAPCVSHAVRFGGGIWETNSQQQVNGTSGEGGGSANGDDDGTNKFPFSLQVATIASLCVGAAVDCCFFSWWEQPWRHLQRSFAEGLRLRLRFLSRRPRWRIRLPVHRRIISNDTTTTTTSGTSGSGWTAAEAHETGSWYRRHRRHRVVAAGRSREERARDARLAHLRRDQEVTERMVEAARRPLPGRSPAREWWECLDDDGVVSDGEFDDDDNNNNNNGDVDGTSAIAGTGTPVEAGRGPPAHV